MSSSPSPAPDVAIRPPLVERAVGGFGWSIGGGAALGVAAWLSDQLAWPYSLLLPANAIGAWLAVAFILGGSARTIPTGALRGLIGLLSAVAAYYLLFAILGEGFRAQGATHAATIWGVVALVAGPIMGGAGAVWRYGTGWPRAIGVAVLAAAFIGESVVFGGQRLVRLDPASDPGSLLYLIELIVGLALPFLLLHRDERLRGYLSTLALAVVAGVAIGPVTAIIRGVADRF
jgi:hypothetical protein